MSKPTGNETARVPYSGWTAVIRTSCDHCGQEFVHGDGCPVAEVDGQPGRDDRQPDLPLATDEDGRAAP